MKRSTLLLLVLCMLTIQLSAQHKNPEKEKQAAQQATKPSTTSLEKIITQKSDSYVVTNENVSKKSGIRHVYLRQAINGLEVYGTESSVHFDKTGKVLTEHNKFLADVQATLKNSAQGIDARAAIAAVANQMGYKISNLQEIKSIGGKNKAAVFNKADISLVDIPVKLMYYYREGIGTQLVWELSIAEKTSTDWWNFRVDAVTGKIIDKENWTVSCNIMDGHNEHFHGEEAVAIPTMIGPLNENEATKKYNKTSKNIVSEVVPALVGGYRVYAMPTESPNHGPRTLQNNPDNATASPFGWHDTNGVAGPEFTVTTGNNVDAHKGSDRPDGTASLIFDFPIDLNQNPASNTAPYITNLFYWNNIVHDVLYQYGFDEVSGNFQENNYGNGGAGSDSVNANAQASGNCNANFGTPADGSNPTMNMFLCNNSTPSHDGDLDAGVIVHEYGHGVSNRLTGGPSNVGCLNNQEQMGEGWSDIYGLILTIEPGDTGTDARGVGTYLLGQPITGNGVRTQRYSTDFAVNNHTYNDIITAVAPHGVGEVWATMLWDMTWGIIGTDGFDPDVYNGTAGNNVSLALITEGLKLQPCSPGFVDGRDAILAADQALYGGAHICTIWEAFARRGLGYSANQGSSGSKTDGTEAFDLPPTFSGLDTVDEVCLSDGIQTGLSGGNPNGGVYSGAGVTDDGNGMTFTFDPTVGGPGLVTVTYTVNDFCTGTPTAITDDINVTNDPPEIVCMGSGNIPMTGSQSSSPGTAIPDNNPTGVTVTMNVTENVSMTDLDVNLNISHTWVGDLIVTIKSPTGTIATIIDRPGVPATTFGCDGNNIVATLDDEAAAPVENVCAGSVPTISGSFTPNNPLSIFDGENTMGIWELTVSDNVGSDTGTINSWGIDYDYEVIAPVLDVTLDGSGNATVNAEDLLYSVSVDCGGYTVLAGSPLAATVSFTCSDTGLNTVAVEVTNDNGAVSTCSAIVNVIGSGGGGGGPFVCPGDITQDNDPGICGAVVTYTVESPSGGCGGGSGPLATGVATLELISSAGGTGNRSGVSYNPSADRYYSVNAGSSGYPVDCFDGTTGAIISNITSGFDYRGAWWNPSLNQSEGNGFDIAGVVLTNLAGDCPNGTTTPILPVNQPDGQSCGDLDYDNNEIIYYNASSITQVDRATGTTNATLALSGTPGGSAYALNSVGYTGVVGYEYAIYDNTTQSVHLYDRATGAYAAASSIGLTTTNYGFAYENGQAWIYNNNRWNGFTIFAAASGTITQTAGLPSGSTFPVGTTTNTFEYDDGINPVQTCSFDVTINDAEVPVITCPGDITVDNDPGVCGALVNYTVTTSDNCSSGSSNSITYTYTGSVETFTVPPGVTSISIEAWGASGQDFTVEQYTPSTGGLGGYASGDLTVTPGDIISIYVGGAGADNSAGYNGGGLGGYGTPSDGWAGRAGSGGGASDVRIGAATLTDRVLVAGGGGGGGRDYVNGTCQPCGMGGNGGDGGALIGIDGQDPTDPIYGFYFNPGAAGKGGTQATGGAGGDGPQGPDGMPGVLGVGGIGIDGVYSLASGGGGGGYYGGGSGAGADTGSGAAGAGGAGGSSYIDGVDNGVTLAGVRSGDGEIVISYETLLLTQTAGLPSGSTFPVGTTTNTFVVTDGAGNTATCSFDVIVNDVEVPAITCPGNITQDNDPGICGAVITYTAPVGTDNCSGSTTVQTAGLASGATFPVGTTTNTFVVTDASGNTATCSFDITINDNEAPVANCAAPFTIQLDANGMASITATDIDNGSTDNCAIASTSIDVTDFTCADVGPNTVTLTVTDVNGNSSTCTTVVTVEDNVAPIAVCQNITVYLDATGNVSIVAGDVDGGSTDACGIANTSIDITDFTCADLGPNNVTLTVTDVNGNTSTCIAVVTVEDDIPPTIACPADVTANTDLGMCSAIVNFPMAIGFDNCSVTVSQTGGLASGSAFPVGVNTVEFTATDGSGNTAVCSFTITVVDNEAPTMVCQNITIQLDEFGNASITAADVDGGSTDNCGIASMSVSPSTFDCSDVGDNPVVLTVTDIHGNSNTCTAIVTVEDVTPPVAVCQNITVELDPVTGTVTITGADVDGGSTDACGIGSYDLDIDTFDCSNIGDNTVVLTVTDVNGNVSTCTAIVTVEDNTNPELVCQDFTLELGPDGTAMLDPNDVIASNTDNCGIATVAVDINEFSCADIGTPVTVQVFASDVNGNLSTCTAVVTVVDLLAPVLTCPADQTVDPGPGNLFYIVPDYFATGEATAIDNCTDPVTILSQSPAAGTPLSDGVYTITLTAEDEYGNVSTCTFELTIESILGVGDHSNDFGSLQMYPNPAKNTVTIGNPQSLSLESLSIFDIRGRMVKSIDLRSMGTQKTIDVSEMAAATYLVIIQGENGQTTKRLIKE